ncbi:MAG: CRTAC1 family protein [Bryobacteraceae bacterium]
MRWIALALLFSFQPAAVRFSDEAERARLRFILQNHPTASKHQVEAMPGGVAAFDFDNDGWEDLYFVNGASSPGLVKQGPADWNRLYRNSHDGTFVDVTEAAGVKGEGYGMGVAAGDFDTDGWTDLFVAGVRGNTLYRNNGNGTFRDITDQAGFKASGAPPWSIAAGWFDYNNDGLLDLFVVNYCKWDPAKEPFCGDSKPGHRTYCHPRHYEGLPNQLYRNNGDGTFRDVSQESGIARHIGKGMGLAFADYDEDGRLDIFVANDTVRNFLFHNDGNGKFTESGLRAGIAFNGDGRALSSMGVDFRDVDNDGKPDLFITALTNETFPLYRYSGQGTFTDATYASQLALLSLPFGGWGAGIYDFNNDGWKDLFAATSDVIDNIELISSRRFKQTSQIFVNAGGARFTASAVGTARAHRGSAIADFDQDGRLDIVVTSLGEGVEFLRNTTEPRQHWLRLLLEGTRSNRDAIGAVVRIGSQMNHVTTSVGYASSSSRMVHFGLGAMTKAATVEIRWPSGIRQTLHDVGADQVLRVKEPSE